MVEPPLLAWDIGGVLLSNAWDRDERRTACEHFGVNSAAFEVRHETVVDDFERGHLSLEGYLERTVGPEGAAVDRTEFRRFMLERSFAHPETLDLARALVRTGAYRSIAFNNESRELNLYRIARYRLAELFDTFLSSCFTGLRKPAPEAFERMLEIVQREPASVVFIDDRSENVAAATQLGFRGIHYQGTGRLIHDLAEVGVRS
ncbi:MAG: HAD-IA family hydrolase [Thermoplasmata archaeon]